MTSPDKRQPIPVVQGPRSGDFYIGADYGGYHHPLDEHTAPAPARRPPSAPYQVSYPERARRPVMAPPSPLHVGTCGHPGCGLPDPGQPGALPHSHPNLETPTVTRRRAEVDAIQRRAATTTVLLRELLAAGFNGVDAANLAPRLVAALERDAAPFPTSARVIATSRAIERLTAGGISAAAAFELVDLFTAALAEYGA